MSFIPDDIITKKSGPSQRQLRVANAIRKSLSAIFSNGSVSSPILLDHSISVNRVDISPDLNSAKIYIYTLTTREKDGEDFHKQIIDELKYITPYLRAQLAKTVKLRKVPNLNFKIDRSVDIINKIGKIFSSHTEE
jgi:ribosome-binding factor A